MAWHTVAFWLLAAVPPDSAAAAARVRARVPIPVKVLRYAQRLVERYDADGDGQLGQEEWRSMEGKPASADRDKDGSVSVAELAEEIARYGRRRKIRLMPALSGGPIRLPSLLSPQMRPDRRSAKGEGAPPGSAFERPGQVGRSAGAARSARFRDTKFTVPRSQLPRGLPASFLAMDRDGDAQLTLAEFAPDGSRTALLQFARYDANGDGLITPREFLAGPRGIAAPAESAEELPEGESEEAVEGPDSGGGEGADAGRMPRIRPVKAKPSGVKSAAGRPAKPTAKGTSSANRRLRQKPKANQAGRAKKRNG